MSGRPYLDTIQLTITRDAQPQEVWLLKLAAVVELARELDGNIYL